MRTKPVRGIVVVKSEPLLSMCRHYLYRSAMFLLSIFKGVRPATQATITSLFMNLEVVVSTV
jgi:hypothetical protein